MPLGHSAGVPEVIPLPDSDGLQLYVLERRLPASGMDGRIPEGTRAVSLFLVNDRDPDSGQRDR